MTFPERFSLNLPGEDSPEFLCVLCLPSAYSAFRKALELSVTSLSLHAHDHHHREEKHGEAGVNIIVKGDLVHLRHIFGRCQNFTTGSGVFKFGSVCQKADFRVGVEQFLQAGVAGQLVFLAGRPGMPLLL